MILCEWTSTQAYSFCLFAAVAYVLFLYVLVPSKIRELPREDVVHIKCRLQAATIAKILIFTVAIYIIPTKECQNLSFIPAFGFNFDWHALFGIVITCFLMCIFYLGELIGNILVLVHARYHIRNQVMHWERSSTPVPWTDLCRAVFVSAWQEAAHSPIIAFRNLVFAPISEELVFRSIIVTVIYLAYAHNIVEDNVRPANIAYRTAWASIGWFGIAHLHHMIEKIRRGEAWTNALSVSLVQLIYTSIFGYIAALLFLRTGSIYPSIVSHMICNFVGLPDMSFMQPPPNHYQRMGCNYPYRYFLIGLHLAGLILFSFLLFPCTEYLSKNSYFYHSSHG